MLSLYHNAVSTCSQKVRLALAEKELDFDSHPIDLIKGEQHDPEYVKINQNHVVPTLVHDGLILLESSLINEYLDEAFPEPPMRPASAGDRHGLRLWAKRVDEKVHPSAGVVTFAIGPRKMLQQQPRDVLEANIAAIPDPVRRAVRRSVIEKGVKAPEFEGALGRLVDLTDEIEMTLAKFPWLSGANFGLADIVVLPYVIRLDHLAMSPLWAADRRPRLADWYARVQARPSFATAVTDWLPQSLLEIFRQQGEEVWPEVSALIDARS